MEDTQFPRSTKDPFIAKEKGVTARPIHQRITALHGILLPLILIGAPGPDEPSLTEGGAPLAHEHAEFSPRPASDLLEAQVVLSRENISCGPIDGVYGAQTQAALEAFQRKHHLRVHGDLDEATRNKLILSRPVLTRITITQDDLEALRPYPSTWVGKSEMDHLGVESVLELAAERGHANPGLIRSLNPEVNWEMIQPGAIITVPDVERQGPAEPISMILIHLAGRTLQTYDASGKLLMHFPCSIARRVDKRPVGQIEVSTVVTDPNYTFDPAVFPESSEARELGRKLVLPPGPNNPVGVAWIGLSLPGYGIHGTPLPGKVGRTESHGCFRLANWDAGTLVQASWIGLPVHVEP